MEFLKRALTPEQWALLLEAGAAQQAALGLVNESGAAKLQGVLDVFKTVPAGAFVEIKVGSNTLAD